MPKLANVRRRSTGRLRFNTKFDHGQPIAKIDTRPMVFVVLFLVLVVGINRYSGPTFLPHVDVPNIEAEPVHRLDERFFVTVTTTRIENNSVINGLYSNDFGECRVYLPNGEAVDSDELYDRAFMSLDSFVTDQRDFGFVFDSGGRWVIPAAYIRADRSTPWQCVAGAIYNLEAAGYPEVKFVTTSVPYPQPGFVY